MISAPPFSGTLFVFEKYWIACWPSLESRPKLVVERVSLYIEKNMILMSVFVIS